MLGEAADWTCDCRSGLRLHASRRTDGPVFQRFFKGYDAAFVLPDEKEDEAGFAACLALNHGDAYVALAAQYGPFVEVCLVADDIASGAAVGGANLIVMPIADAAGQKLVTANLNYIFVDTGSRGKGYFARLFDAIGEVVAELLESEVPPLIFIEQNDPFRMPAENYERDTRFTGLDQIDRLRMWAKLGAKVVDFPYAQPPLSAEQEPDETLVYSVLGAAGDRLDAAVLHGHLTRFFGISVLKGAPLGSEPCAAAQLDALAAMAAAGESVRLFDPRPLLAQIGSRDDARQLFGALPKTFRDALAAMPD